MSKLSKLSSLLSLLLCAAAPVFAQAPPVTTVATGLSDPRGLAFAPNGDLYVAEAWTAPGTLTTTNCFQSVIGPFTGGFTSRISRVRRGEETPEVVAGGFPSSSAAVGDNFGLADLTFDGPHLLALSGGGGCSKGHPEAVSEVLAIGRDGARRSVANLSTWILANPGQKGVEQFQTPDYEPDGVWFGMTRHRGRLLAVEANHGLLVEVDTAAHGHGAGPGDRVALVADLYKTFGDNTYTSLATRGRSIYLGTYGRFDNNFAGGIYRLSPRGHVQVASGLTSVIAIAFDREKRLYALQAPIFDGGGAGLGSLVRINDDGTHTVLLSGLASPGSLTRGPDGALYLTQCSFHCAPGTGWVSRVDVGR
jgi:hypothetical protein